MTKPNEITYHLATTECTKGHLVSGTPISVPLPLNFIAARQAEWGWHVDHPATGHALPILAILERMPPKVAIAMIRAAASAPEFVDWTKENWPDKPIINPEFAK